MAVLTEARVAALHLPALAPGSAAAGIEAAVLELPPGEATKGWAGLERAVEWLIAEKVGRDDLVVAFGGGVIGDLAGFAAAVAAPRRRLRPDPDDAPRPGRQLGRRQDRDQLAARART